MPHLSKALLLAAVAMLGLRGEGNTQELQISPLTTKFIAEIPKWNPTDTSRYSITQLYRVEGIATLTDNSPLFRVSYDLSCILRYDFRYGKVRAVSYDTLYDNIRWRKIDGSTIKIVNRDLNMEQTERNAVDSANFHLSKLNKKKITAASEQKYADSTAESLRDIAIEAAKKSENADNTLASLDEKATRKARKAAVKDTGKAKEVLKKADEMAKSAMVEKDRARKNADSIDAQIWKVEDELNQREVKVAQTTQRVKSGNFFYVKVPGIAFGNSAEGSAEPQRTSYTEPHAPYHKRYLRRLYDEAVFRQDRTYASVCISYMPAIAYRTIGVQSSQLQYQERIDSRDNNEHSIYGQSYNVSIGWSFTKTSALCIEGFRQFQGFSNDSATMNWHTGEAEKGMPDEYKFDQWGLGLVYRYTGYGASINGTLELGLYGTKLDTYNSNYQEVVTDGGIRSMNLRLYGMVAKVGLGLCIHPDYRYEIRLIPTAYFNLMSVDKGSVLRTYPYTVGFTIGWNWRFLL